MSVSIFIHGTPSSQSSTSQALFNGLEERIIAEFFKGENVSSTSTYLVYETRQWDDFVCSVYTFYKDVNGNSGRKGCYCALTVIVKDFVCLDFAIIYRVLESAFINEIQGNLGILRNNKFLVSSFSRTNSISVFEERIRTQLAEATFIPLNTRYKISNYSSTPVCFNNGDLNSSEFINAVQNDGKVFISNSYETIEARKRRLEQEHKAYEHKNDSEVHSFNDTHDLETNDTDSHIRSYADPDLTKLRVSSLEDKVRNLGNAIEQGANGNLMNGILHSKPLEWLNLANFILLCVCLFTIQGNFTKSSEEVSNAQYADSVDLQRKDSIIVTLKDSIRILNDSINASKELMNK